MPYARQPEASEIEHRPWLVAISIVLAFVLIALSMIWRMVLLNADEVAETDGQTRVEEIRQELRYVGGLDIPLLDELLAIPEAIPAAEGWLVSDTESDRYLGIIVFARHQLRTEQPLTQTQLQRLRQRLSDRSPAIRTYAAFALIEHEDTTGVAHLIEQLTNATPLSFMEPPVTQSQFATLLLNQTYPESGIVDDDPSGRQTQWQQWWSEQNDSGNDAPGGNQ